MSEEMEFPDGIFYKEPHTNAPDFVKGSLSINIAKTIGWLNTKAQSGEWVNLSVKVSKNGKTYLAVDNWKPKGKDSADENAHKQYGKPSDHENNVNMQFEDVSDSNDNSSEVPF